MRQLLTADQVLTMAPGCEVIAEARRTTAALLARRAAYANRCLL